jgi:hypothetical protein
MTDSNEVDPSTARKRRKELLATTRQNTESKRLRTASPDDESDKTKTKYQNRYEPEVQMTKEEAAEWRREARRKRNRESAAASRNKVRSRIEELETEVDGWKSRYSQLLDRIDRLEQRAGPSANPLAPGAGAGAANGVEEVTSSNQYVSPCTSPVSNFSAPLTLDSLPFNLSVPEIDCHPNMPEDSADTQEQLDEFHVIEMTSRPA